MRHFEYSYLEFSLALTQANACIDLSTPFHLITYDKHHESSLQQSDPKPHGNQTLPLARPNLPPLPFPFLPFPSSPPSPPVNTKPNHLITYPYSNHANTPHNSRTHLFPLPTSKARPPAPSPHPQPHHPNTSPNQNQLASQPAQTPRRPYFGFS